MEFFVVTIDCFFVFTEFDPRHHNGLYCHPSVFKLSLPASLAFLPTLLSLRKTDQRLRWPCPRLFDQRFFCPTLQSLATDLRDSPCHQPCRSWRRRKHWPTNGPDTAADLCRSPSTAGPGPCRAAGRCTGL